MLSGLAARLFSSSGGGGDAQTTSAFMQLIWMSYALPLLTAAWSAIVRAAKLWFAPRTRRMLLFGDSDPHTWMCEFLYAWAVDVDSVTTSNRLVPSAKKIPAESFVPDPSVSHYILVAFSKCASGGCFRASIRCTSARFLAMSSSPRDRLIASTAWLYSMSSVVVCAKLVQSEEDGMRTSLTTSSALLGGDTLLEAMSALVDFTAREFKSNNPGTVARYVPNRPVYHVNVRPLSTIVMHDSTRRMLVDGIRDFKSAAVKDLYARIGRPRKLCILIHGPPGTGKSSVLPALCQLFGAKRMFAHSTCDSASIASSSTMMSSQSTMVVFEDIDRSFGVASPSPPSVDAPGKSNEKTTSGAGAAGPPLGPLLELLDGTNWGTDSMIVLTANNVDVLPAVLLRPGRVDLIVEFGYADASMLAEYVRLFFSITADEGAGAPHAGAATERQVGDIAELLMKTMGPKVTLAQVQAFLFEHREGPEAMIATLLSTADTCK
jgi:hypothetical protein